MRRLLSFFCLLASPLAAEPPRVVADIAPVHGLVSMVMEGSGTPELLIPPGVSAHDMALKPSQARALMQADLVVWIGPEMSPWLDRALAAGDAQDLVLMEVPETQLYAFRETALFGDHAHDGHVEEAGHDHDHGGEDPHVWLDPMNAAVWLPALADALAGLDPENAALYRANAEAGVAELTELTDSLQAQMAPVRDVPLIAFHDAFQYFEARFGLTMVGAITAADDSDPGPARGSALRDAAREGRVVCAMAEPQFNPGLLDAVTEEAGLPVAILDPLGSNIDLGSGFYEALLKQMAGAVTECVGSAGK